MLECKSQNEDNTNKIIIIKLPFENMGVEILVLNKSSKIYVVQSTKKKQVFCSWFSFF